MSPSVASAPRRFTGRCLAWVMALPALLPAADPAAKPATPDPAKPYVLFMGADLAVQREKRYYRVEDVQGSELKIRIGKRQFLVPTRNRATSLKVNNSLKLTLGSVTLEGLQGGPAYTPANDPKLKFDRESGAAGGAAAVQDLAYGRMIALNLGASQAGLATSGQTGTAADMARAEAQAAQGKADQALHDAATMGAQMQYSAQYNTGNLADQMQRDLAEGNYDAMEVSFKLSSPVELDDPYMIILFRFQEREAKAGEEGMLIHAKSLEPIGPKPKYIRVRESGLPRGFKYINSEVHIYNRGEEVATNASAKRVELSRAEAQQYLVIDHIGTNKGATLPAVAVPGTLPLGLRQKLSLEQLNRTLYAKVSKDGEVLGAYADESCNLQLDDPATAAALGELFFKPALVNGKPVEGTARVKLGEI